MPTHTEPFPAQLTSLKLHRDFSIVGSKRKKDLLEFKLGAILEFN